MSSPPDYDESWVAVDMDMSDSNAVSAGEDSTAVVVDHQKMELEGAGVTAAGEFSFVIA